MSRYVRSKYTRLQIFYGDDGRRVKTVYVSNIREGTTCESLVRKYSTYGPVQSCELKCHEDSDQIYAIITMDYAFDASKILRDWPEEVKQSYSMLPKKKCSYFEKTSAAALPKQRYTENKNILESAVVQTHQRDSKEPVISYAVSETIQNGDVPQAIVEDPIVIPRRCRAVRTTASKVKKRITEITRQITILTSPQATANIQIESSIRSNYESIAQNPASSEDIQINPFTSLNDDCLLSIFTICDKLDLVNLARVCERFRFIVHNYLIDKISKIVDLSKIKSCDLLTLCEATQFLKFIDAAQNIQHLGVAMSAFVKYDDLEILKEIFRSCGPNLHRITLDGFHLTDGFTSQWNHVFRRVECLTFNQCIFSTNFLNSILNICEKLEVLNVTNSSTISCDFEGDNKLCPPTQLKCNKLKEFRLISSRYCGKPSELIWLFENNPNLKVLQMLEVGDSLKLTGNIFQHIGRYQQMQDLAFSFGNVSENLVNNLHHLIQLKDLRSLSLKCDWMNISPFAKLLSQLNQIESLSFENIDIDISFLKSISKFRKLKYLKLENTFVNEPSQEAFELSLMDLTYRLNNLKYFHCQSHLFTEDSLVQFIGRMKKLEYMQISGLVMNLVLFMRFVNVCESRGKNGVKLNVVVDNYRYLIEYLDLLRSEYGKFIRIKSVNE